MTAQSHVSRTRAEQVSSGVSLCPSRVPGLVVLEEPAVEGYDSMGSDLLWAWKARPQLPSERQVCEQPSGSGQSAD